MTGKEVKGILTSNGYSITDVANRLGVSQPNLSMALKVADVKTGLLEKICKVLGVEMDFFYPGVPKFVEEQPDGYRDDDLRSEIDRLNAMLQERTDALALVQGKYIDLLEKIQSVPTSSANHTKIA